MHERRDAKRHLEQLCSNAGVQPFHISRIPLTQDETVVEMAACPVGEKFAYIVKGYTHRNFLFRLLAILIPAYRNASEPYFEVRTTLLQQRFV